jgi:outer membrane protein assembly factor BamB
VPLDGKPTHALGKVSITWRPSERRPFFSYVPGRVTGCQLDPTHLYVSTRREGIYAFPLDGRPGRRLDKAGKMPSEGVESLALYNGLLYAGLDGGYLVTVDVQTGRVEVLASSRRREKATPFDDGEAFTVPYLAADPERRRLVFVLFQGRTGRSASNGLWALDPKARKFTRLLETGGAENALTGGAIRDGRLLLSSADKAIDFDLAKDKYTLLWSFANPSGPVLLNKMALCQESFSAEPPHVYRDGWLWAAHPFGRVSIADKKQELFVAPRRRRNAPDGRGEVLLPVGKDRLLYGSSSALWLITLRKK